MNQDYVSLTRTTQNPPNWLDKFSWLFCILCLKSVKTVFLIILFCQNSLISVESKQIKQCNFVLLG